MLVEVSVVTASAEQDLVDVTSRLRGALDGASGKIRVTDALVLAGFEQRSRNRASLVARAMHQLGWERRRCYFDGQLAYAYARGSYLEREFVLEVERDADGRPVVRRREPRC
jgi:hypothetical protein